MLVGVREVISFSIFKTNILSTTWIFSTYSNYLCVLNQTRGLFIFFCPQIRVTARLSGKRASAATPAAGCGRPKRPERISTGKRFLRLSAECSEGGGILSAAASCSRKVTSSGSSFQMAISPLLAVSIVFAVFKPIWL